MHKSYFDVVIEKIEEAKNYPFINFSINVDGTACLLVKRQDHQYYERKFQNNELNKDSTKMAQSIIDKVEAYWTGWGFKKGLRDVSYCKDIVN